MPGTTESALVVLIQVLTGGWRNRELFFLHPEQLLLGRRSSDMDVVFSPDDKMVSNRHLRLERRDEGYLLVDESKLGTYLFDQEGTGPQRPSAGTRIEQLLLRPGSTACLQLGTAGPVCRLMIGQASPFGRYQLVGVLGKGGMGEVDLAWERPLRRLVVLKVLRQNLPLQAAAAEQMLIREARLGAVVPNALTVYDVQRERGILYIAMEYLRGVTLADLTGQLFQIGERLPPTLCAALIRQACLGLHAVHTAIDPGGQPLRIVHRDVSPYNIMLTPEGVIKVIDFGVARAGLNLSLSSDSHLVGSPPYMSPEQIHRPNSLDHRSDVFSLGVVLWELCTGKRLFCRDDGAYATFQAVCTDPVPPLRELCPEAPEALCSAVHQALTRDPDGRQQSALELALQLQQMEFEAGSAFVDPAKIAGYLEGLGVLLLGRLPRPMTDMPDWLQGSDVGPSPMVLAEGRTIAAERYRLLRCLSPEAGIRASRRRAHWKRLYLAEKATAPSERLLAIVCGGAESPHALPEKEATRLFEFAERHRDAAPDSPLPPVLDHGLCWKDGPSYLMVPYYQQTLSARLGVVAGEQVVRLGREMFGALERILLQDPAYRHGDLKPENIALVPHEEAGEGGERVVLLDLHLPDVLGLKESPAEPAAAEPEPYWAPEQRRGGPPSAAGDVFAMGMMLYQMCGGDLAQAAQAIDRDQEPPSLRCEGLAGHLAGAVFSALRAAPDERPSAAQMVRLLDPPAALDEIEVVLPLSPDRQVVRAPGQQRVELRHVALDPLVDREPVPLPLPLPALPEDGPELLWIFLLDHRLELRVSPLVRAGGRLEIYKDPPGSGTHVIRYDLRPEVPQGTLWIGHHRRELQRVRYGSASRSAAARELAVHVPDLGLRVTAPAHVRRLVVLHVSDPRRGLVSMVCVTVGPR